MLYSCEKHEWIVRCELNFKTKISTSSTPPSITILSLVEENTKIYRQGESQRVGFIRTGSQRRGNESLGPPRHTHTHTVEISSSREPLGCVNGYFDWW